MRGALALAQPRQVRRRIGSPALGSSATSQSAAGGSSGSIGCHQCEQSAATRFPLFGFCLQCHQWELASSPQRVNACLGVFWFREWKAFGATSPGFPVSGCAAASRDFNALTRLVVVIPCQSDCEVIHLIGINVIGSSVAAGGGGVSIILWILGKRASKLDNNTGWQCPSYLSFSSLHCLCRWNISFLDALSLSIWWCYLDHCCQVLTQDKNLITFFSCLHAMSNQKRGWLVDNSWFGPKAVLIPLALLPLPKWRHSMLGFDKLQPTFNRSHKIAYCQEIPRKNWDSDKFYKILLNIRGGGPRNVPRICHPSCQPLRLKPYSLLWSSNRSVLNMLRWLVGVGCGLVQSEHLFVTACPYLVSLLLKPPSSRASCISLLTFLDKPFNAKSTRTTSYKLQTNRIPAREVL